MSKAYHGGHFFKAIGEDFSSLDNAKSIISADVLDAWFDPSPKVINKITNNLNFIIRTSPPTHCDGLMRTISEIRGIDLEEIAVGGGSSDIMFYVLPNILDQNSKVVILDPMYGEYLHILKNVVECNILKYQLKEEDNFSIDIEDFCNYINNNKPDCVIIVNPNSPTGKYLDKEKIINIIKKIPQTTKFIIDETYIEYIDSDLSVEKEVKNYNNLIIIKSMSKIYALSGLRVAYIISNSDFIKNIDKFIPPRCVSLPGQIAGIEALKDYDYYKTMRDKTNQLRKELEKGLNDIKGLKVIGSCANFLLINIQKLGISSKDMTKELRERNIFIRDCSPWSDILGERYIRIAVKDQETNNLIIDSIKYVVSTRKTI